MKEHKMQRLLFYFLALNILWAGSIMSAEEPKLSYQILDKCQHSKGDCYRLVKFKAENFPSTTPLQFVVKLMNGTITEDRKVTIDSEGHVIDVDLQQEWYLGLGKFFNGEPIKCMLFTDNKEVFASTRIIPYPIEKKDQAGHELSLELITPDGEHFRLKAKGFEPSEKLTLYSTSESENLHQQVTASPEGEIISMISPAVVGKKSGKASLELKGKTTNQLKVDYEWGWKPNINSKINI